MRDRPDFWRGNERICWVCAFMEAFVGTDSLEHAPALLSGFASIADAPALAGARQAAFNLRQMTLAYTTTTSVKHGVALYNDHHYRHRTQGSYVIDPATLRFRRTDPLADPLVARAVIHLSAPAAAQPHAATPADPHLPMQVSLGDPRDMPPIPVGPIAAPLAPRRTHDTRRAPAGAIRVPLEELRSIAAGMDARDAAHPGRRRGNWAKRLERIVLMVPEAGRGLREDSAIELSALKHLIGLPGAGKTTLLMLLAVWLGQRRLKTMLVFPSIEVARQYMADLAFHGVAVGMLVGQNPTTRRRHADHIAEAIAASGGQGGFASTLEGAGLFAINCVLPAFSVADTSAWGFGDAPCETVLQDTDGGRLRPRLCPLWTMCGRNAAPRGLVDADVWVGHVLSMDTAVPAHAIDERLRYFELIAGTFDVVVFDEADMVQSALDSHGAAQMSISGSEESIHRVIQEQIHSRFASGENHRLFDRNIELYSRDLAEFGNHNTSLIAAVQNVAKRVGDRYADQLLTTSRMIGELLDGFERRPPRRDDENDPHVAHGFTRARALTDLWDTSAYAAFYDRTGFAPVSWPKADLCARTLEMDRTELETARDDLVRHFRRYLAENLVERRDAIMRDVSQTFLAVCFRDTPRPVGAQDAVILLVAITFMILGYQRIVPGTRTMVAEGLVREPIVKSTASQEMRRFIPESILGSLSGVKYSFTQARTTRGGARNVELTYLSFVGAPRLLMHRFHRLLERDGERPGPAVLLTSATSVLEASPAYHIDAGPHYVLKPRAVEHSPDASAYRFKWIPDPHDDQPLRYSGAGDLGERNLERMVEALVRGGTAKSEIYKAIRSFDVRHGIHRKAALITNGYAQARAIKRFLDENHRDIGRRTKAVVRSLEKGEKPSDYVTTAQAEALGDDDTCDIVVFPMSAIGRGINIVFTKGPRERDAAIGSIYFLTRPHPSSDDMQLLLSMAGRASQEFDARTFEPGANLAAIADALRGAKFGSYRLARRLLQEPLMASRLGAELFRPFTANQMVAILQTIGRGMRNGCPVSVYFVDAAWAYRSALDQTDTARDSMLVQMRAILEECLVHPDPVTRAIYAELYGAFLAPLRRISGVNFPADLGTTPDDLYRDDGFDDSAPLLEM